MPEIIQQIEPEPKFEFVSASNNAAWSVGEIALHYGRGEFLCATSIDFCSIMNPPYEDPEFLPYVQPLIQRLVPILLNPRSPKSLTENAAVTIGRIALVFPDPVAPFLEQFAQQW